MRVKLTKRVVDTLPSPAKGETFAWATQLPGFGVRFWASGGRSYVIQFRDENGKSCRRLLGNVRNVSFHEAKWLAERLLVYSKVFGDVLGEDLVELRRRYRADPANQQRLAHARVAVAIATGKMKRPTICEGCKQPSKEIHAHHEDYSRPLWVSWLCPACHHGHHAAQRSDARKRQQPERS
jgi:Arm DNA-binding domain